MSVINQMLRDLDAREANAQERVGLPPRLRTLPPAKVARAAQWRMLVLGIGIGAALAGVAAGFFRQADMASPAPAAVSAVPVAPVAAPPAPSLALPALPPVVVAADAADAQPPTPPPEPVRVPAKPAAARPAVPAKSVIAAPESKAVPATAAAPSPEPAEARIDKRSKGGPPGREVAETEYRKGMLAAGNGDNAAALQSLRRALELEPHFPKARQALLSVLAGGKHWAEVRQVAADGLALDPARSDWASILARLQHDQGDSAAALETLERHAAFATRDADYQGLLAYLLQKQQRHAEAVPRYQAALALRPGEGRWWYGLGLALEAAGRGGEAREAYAQGRESGNLPADLLAALEQKLK